MPRPRKPTRPARQYARPGCCYELPIAIDDDEQVEPKNTNTKPLSNHTAAWMEALAKGRWEGGANRPSAEVAQVQGSRKRVIRDVDEDNEEPRNGGSKRLRLSGGDSYSTRVTPHAIHRPFHRTTPDHPTKTVEGQAEDNLGAPQMGLRTRRHQIDQEKPILRNMQTSLNDDKERAHATNLREQQYQSAFRSSLHTMWQEYDRQREAANERLKIAEREEREKANKQAREREEKRLGEIASIEDTIRSMWEADPLDARGDPKVRPGQLSAAGQRRVREREESMRQSRF